MRVVAVALALEQVVVEPSGALQLRADRGEQDAADLASLLTPPCEAPGEKDAQLEKYATEQLSSVYGGATDLLHAPEDMEKEDGEEAWKDEGGGDKSHLYGEVTPKGMFDVLSSAVCAVNCSTGLRATLPKYAFFDLGAGFGKFPIFAASLGMQATGIELDEARFAEAANYTKRFQAGTQCPVPTVLHGSFLDETSPWLLGTEPRVVFLDAVAFGEFWDQISALMKKAEWGSDSVVASIGREFGPASGLVSASTDFAHPVQTSWGIGVLKLYRKDPKA